MRQAEQICELKKDTSKGKITELERATEEIAKLQKETIQLEKSLKRE